MPMVITNNASSFNRYNYCRDEKGKDEWIHPQDPIKCIFTRQAVKDRALQYPELSENISEENLEAAEETMQEIMRLSDPQLRFKVAEHYLRYKGRKRGYTDKTEVEHSGGINNTNQNIDLSKGTDEELNLLIAQARKEIENEEKTKG